jgi:hypothetical protein
MADHNMQARPASKEVNLALLQPRILSTSPLPATVQYRLHRIETHIFMHPNRHQQCPRSMAPCRHLPQHRGQAGPYADAYLLVLAGSP